MIDPKHEARRIDPTEYLESRGFEVKREGRHISVRRAGSEVYRLTLRPDQTYVACRQDGGGIGDNISLVMDVERCDFARALNIFTSRPSGHRPSRAQSSSAVAAQSPRPRLPPSTYADGGQEYLRGRGILPKVLDHAENSGFLSYAYGCVFFVGRDELKHVRSVARRGYMETDQAPKRDLAGSNKYYPPILCGQTHTHAWIVEGGCDALAIHSLAIRAGEPPPTVVVSGGAGAYRFIDNPQVLEIMEGVDAICISAEWEKDEQTQAKVDDQRRRLLNRLPGCHIVWPPAGDKDISALNERIYKEKALERLQPSER